MRSAELDLNGSVTVCSSDANDYLGEDGDGEVGIVGRCWGMADTSRISRSRISDGECTEIGCGVHLGFWWARSLRARCWVDYCETGVSFTTASVDAARALSFAGASVDKVVEIVVSAFTSAVGAEKAGASCCPSIAGAPAVFFFQPTLGRVKQMRTTIRAALAAAALAAVVETDRPPT